MKNLALILLLAVILSACISQQETPWQSQALQSADPSSQGFSAEKLGEIEQLFQSNIDQGKIAGATALVARRGKIVYYKSTGYDDLENKTALKEDAIFRIASQSKGVSSVAIMILYEEGRIKLSDPISTHLPEFGYPVLIDEFNQEDTSYTTRPAKRAITIQDLLTHTSGYSYPGNGGDAGNAIYAKAHIMNGVPSKTATLKDEMQKIARLPLIHEPGEKFTYGLSTDILGYLVEVLTGQSLEDFFMNRIFEPLGIQDTYFHLPASKHHRLMNLYQEKPQGEAVIIASGPYQNYPKNEDLFCSGGGGLSSTTLDYAIFIQMLLNQGEYNGTRILKPETIQLMRTNHIGDLGAGSLFLTASPDKFGLGFEVIYPSPEDSTLISEGAYGWGGAFGSLYWIDPQKEMIVQLTIQKTGEYAELRHEFVNTVYRAIEH
jgi:CubicO group peptidase (beta-lactamase class C family)